MAIASMAHAATVLCAFGALRAARVVPGSRQLHTLPRARLAAADADESFDPFVARFDAAAREIAALDGIPYMQAQWKPPVLRVEVERSAGSEQLQLLNRRLSDWLDQQEEAEAPDLPAGNFDLEVTTPGASDTLSTDREFEAFKGFDVTVTTSAPHKGKSSFAGTLHSRDEKHVCLNLRGRMVRVPRELVEAVTLPAARDGDKL